MADTDTDTVVHRADGEPRITIASIDPSVGASGNTGFMGLSAPLGDEGPVYAMTKLLPSGLSPRQMKAFLESFYSQFPGSRLVIVVEAPYLPEDRRKWRETLGLSRVTHWWEAAGALAGADVSHTPMAQTWRPLLSALCRQHKVPPPRGQKQWRDRAVQFAPTLLGQPVESHDVANAVIMGFWGLEMERLRAAAAAPANAALADMDALEVANG